MRDAELLHELLEAETEDEVLAIYDLHHHS